MVGILTDGVVITYRFLFRGPGERLNKSAGDWEAWQASSNLSEELRGFKADHLRIGEKVKVIMINRATGYVGTSVGTYGENIQVGLISFTPAPVIMPAHVYGDAVSDYLKGHEQNYNNSERAARMSAQGLATVIGSLEGNPNVHLVAHSQGNVVVSEALKKLVISGSSQPNIKTFVALHAATSKSGNTILNYRYLLELSMVSPDYRITSKKMAIRPGGGLLRVRR